MANFVRLYNPALEAYYSAPAGAVGMYLEKGWELAENGFAPSFQNDSDLEPDGLDSDEEEVSDQEDD